MRLSTKLFKVFLVGIILVGCSPQHIAGPIGFPTYPSFKERGLRQGASRHIFFAGTGGGGNPAATEDRQIPVTLIDKTSRKAAGVELENWYVYLGLGYANLSYTGSLKTFQKCPRLPCKSHSSALKLFGFYWPLKNKKTIIGPVYNLSQ